MEALVFRRVVKKYGRIEALRGASFRVPRGVLAGLVGPNGAGKTTAFRVALGFARRESGEVRVLGVDPEREETVRLRIGYLPEKPVYPQDVTVEEFLVHAARVRGVDPGEALRLARVMGLGDKLGLPIRGLSRGYLQRLGLAHAFLGDPELLLLDEPTANLDPAARREILELIRSLARDIGATLVVSTHILPELQRVADYLIVLNRGVVVAEGSVAEIAEALRAPLYIRVAARSGEDARRIASRLVLDPGVSALEIKDETIVVRCKPCDGVEELLSRLVADGEVLGYSRVSGEIEEVYRLLAGGGG